MEQAMAKAKKDSSDYAYLCRRAAQLYLYTDVKKAAFWAQKALDYYRENGGTAKWLNPLHESLIWMYIFGELQLAAGNVRAAGQMMQEMKTRPMCTRCDAHVCTEALELEIDICYVQGRYEEALTVCEQVLRESLLNADVRARMALIKKKLKTGKVKE